MTANTAQTRPSSQTPTALVISVTLANKPTVNIILSYLEGHKSLDIKPFRQDLIENCENSNVARPTCVRDLWSNTHKIDTRENVPVAFLMPGTNEDVNVSRWKVGEGQIVIAQQRPGSKIAKMFNNGEPAIIVPTPHVAGKRQIWRKWEPDRGFDSMAPLEGYEQLIHRTRRDDNAYHNFIGHETTGSEECARSTGTQSPYSDQPRNVTSKASNKDPHGGSKPSKKRPRTSVATSSESTDSEYDINYDMHRRLPPTKFRRRDRLSLPSNPSSAPRHNNPSAAASSAQRSASTEPCFVFQPSRDPSQHTRIELAMIDTNEDLFHYAMACDVANNSTNILSITLNNEAPRYVLRKDESFFNKLLATVRNSRELGANNRRASGCGDLVVTDVASNK